MRRGEGGARLPERQCISILGDFAVLPQQAHEQAGLTSQLTLPGQDTGLETSWESFQPELFLDNFSGEKHKIYQRKLRQSAKAYTFPLPILGETRSQCGRMLATGSREKGLCRRGSMAETSSDTNRNFSPLVLVFPKAFGPLCSAGCSL